MRIPILTGLLIIFGPGICLPAQVSDDRPVHAEFFSNLYITPAYQAGFVLPEYKYFLYMVNEPVQSAGLSISKRTNGKNDWEQIYGFPEYGISFFCSTLGNDLVFGREFAVYPYFSFPVFSGNRWGLFNQIGLGINYVNRKFDLDHNYQNIVVGSKLNVRFNYRLDLRFHFLRRCRLNTGLSFDHFSNANMQEPNIGINCLNAFLGMGYCIGDPMAPVRHELKPHGKSLSREFTFAIGGKHTRAFQSDYFYTFSGTAELKWKPYRMFGLGAGADLFYDSSTETEMQALDRTGYKKLYDFRTGIHVAQQVIYGRVSLIIQEGIYLFLTDRVNHKKMYNRGIVRVDVTDHIMVSISMKTHLHILDYPELGFGVRF